MTWCTNLWVEQREDWTGFSPSLYTAYELTQAQWLFDRGGAEEWWQRTHVWVSDWLPHMWRAAGPLVPFSGNDSFLLSLLNYVMYILQRTYMKAHHTREWVDYHVAAFHPRATSEIVRQGWVQELRQIVTHLHLTHRWTEWSLPAEVVLALAAARRHRYMVVLATGVFDLFHQEHQRFLAKAKAAGDFLVVGLESDQRARELKGPGRPRQSQDRRARQLIDSGVVDAVFILPPEFGQPLDHRVLLDLLKPQVLAVSSHSPHQAKKAALMKKIGGELRVVHQHNPAVSTTQLLAQQAT